MSIEVYVASHSKGARWGYFDFNTAIACAAQGHQGASIKALRAGARATDLNADELLQAIEPFHLWHWNHHYGLDEGVTEVLWSLLLCDEGGNRRLITGVNGFPALTFHDVSAYPGELFNALLVGLNHALERMHFDF